MRQSVSRDTFMRICLFIVPIILLCSGCLYPQDRLSGGMEALPRHIEEVQQAVDRYSEQQSVLPIKTLEADTPIYQKYVIDFGRLVPVYMGEPPPSSFENGGNFMYVLIDVEENPTVKVFDLRVPEELRDVQHEINDVTVKEKRYPRGIEIAPGVFELNGDLLRYVDKKIPSPYDPQSQLPLVMDSDGTVYVDYSKDIERIIAERDNPPPEGVDLRTLLTEESPFVPAQSLPYRYENGEVVFDVKP